MPRNHVHDSVPSDGSRPPVAVILWKTYTKGAISRGGLDREATREQDPDKSYQYDITLSARNRFIAPGGVLLEKPPYTDTLYEREMGRIESVMPLVKVLPTRVIDIGLILKASSHALESFPTERLHRWAAESYRFVCDVFGEDNVHLAVLHMDETSPHIHVHVTPLRERTVTEGKNTRTVAFLDVEGYTSPYERRRIYGEYVERMAPFGLGEGRRGSRLEYRDVHSLYDEANMEADKAVALRRALHAYNHYARVQLLRSREELALNLDILSEVEGIASGILAAGEDSELSLSLPPLDFSRPDEAEDSLSAFLGKDPSLGDRLRGLLADLSSVPRVSINPVSRAVDLAGRAAALQREIDSALMDRVLGRYVAAHHRDVRRMEDMQRALGEAGDRGYALHRDLATTALCLDMVLREGEVAVDCGVLDYVKREILASSLGDDFISEHLCTLFHDELSLRSQIPWLGGWNVGEVYEFTAPSTLSQGGEVPGGEDESKVEWLGNIPVNRSYLTGADDPSKFARSVLWEDLSDTRREEIRESALRIFESKYPPEVGEELSLMYGREGSADVLRVLSALRCRSQSWDRRRTMRGMLEDIRLGEQEAERMRFINLVQSPLEGPGKRL